MDKRVNQKLVAAYARLLKKDTKRITVSLLCEKADVSRATFYIYYKDLDDFIGKLHRHIVDVFFEQATLFLCCSDWELEKAVKKENLLYSESELDVLNYMVSGSNYVDFALLMDNCCIKRQNKSPFTDEMWKKYKDELNIFTRGYFTVLVFGFVFYEENAFKSDIRNCRLLFKYLCTEIIKI